MICDFFDDIHRAETVLLVEPHPDDICLSTHSIIKRIENRNKLFLLSLYTGKISSRAYCNEMGINFFGYGSENEILFSNRMPIKRFNKMKNPFYEQLTYYEKMKEADTEFTDWVNKANLALTRTMVALEPDIVISPVGIYHPWHVITADYTRKASKELAFKNYFYAEIPYSCRKYGEKILDNSGFTSVLEVEPSEDKIKIFSKSYPPLKNILRFDRENIATAKERIFK
jgi:hypothetical protein